VDFRSIPKGLNHLAQRWCEARAPTLGPSPHNYIYAESVAS
jgi:hypothetical protein